MSERVFYTLSQIAQLLGVHYETVARWVRAGKLRGVKLSRRKVLVPSESLDAFLAQNEVSSRSVAGLPFGSPKKWLALVGTLTPEEGEAIRTSLKDLDLIEDL